jgi:hypothetical protein
MPDGAFGSPEFDGGPKRRSTAGYMLAQALNVFLGPGAAITALCHASFNEVRVPRFLRRNRTGTIFVIDDKSTVEEAMRRPLMPKPRPTLDGRELSADDLRSIRAHIDQSEAMEVSDQMRALIEQQWPELLGKIKPPQSDAPVDPGAPPPRERSA